ncbi:class I SAM-dependent methyltransferase [Acrocarpospora catenulata]|uniref:class I SAM-dependent methyltransferase n=1 Tax=Acrocarpospora catenulata TaxID=2836182 RepID=UPI0027E025C4|nr:class I SAM-dependent methyltransferase [Acrocarpospora catenulata]
MNLGLLGDAELERSPVVANNAMNRERRLAGYRRELGLDIARFLRDRISAGAVPRWLDLCCGTANALFEAARTIPGEFELVGVDLVDFFAGPPTPPRLQLITASITTWTPDAPFDLITSVHGLHYIGDKLAILTKAATWLAPDGLFIANFDPHAIRDDSGTPFGPRLTRDLRATGFTYNSRTRRITCPARRDLTLPYTYLGSDDHAGPNYTGQPAVNSHYLRS